jgi:hypothetical protein
MLSFREFTSMGTADLPKLPKLQKLPKLPKLNRRENSDEGQTNSRAGIQRMTRAEAIPHLRRMIVHLSMLIHRLSQG